MARIVVVNLAWDKNADFGYLKEGNEPHEKYNFKKTESGYYAYFALNKRINIEHLGGDNNADKVSNIFVIFVSTKRNEGRKIVGYYENADVYGEPKKKGNPNTLEGKPINYHFHSEIAKEYPPEDRPGPFDITSKEKGSGLMGRLIWYPDLSKPKVKNIIREMLNSIDKLDILNETLEEIREDEDKSTASSFNNDEQRKKRLSQKENKLPIEELRQVKFFKRDEDVKAEVLKNAKGICAKCKKEAPFVREHGALKGQPYLEIHHKIWLSEGGKDNIKNAVALCPNCHREEHCGKRFWN